MFITELNNINKDEVVDRSGNPVEKLKKVAEKLANPVDKLGCRLEKFYFYQVNRLKIMNYIRKILIIR